MLIQYNCKADHIRWRQSCWSLSCFADFVCSARQHIHIYISISLKIFFKTFHDSIQSFLVCMVLGPKSFRNPYQEILWREKQKSKDFIMHQCYPYDVWSFALGISNFYEGGLSYIDIYIYRCLVDHIQCSKVWLGLCNFPTVPTRFHHISVMYTPATVLTFVWILFCCFYDYLILPS